MNPKIWNVIVIGILSPPLRGETKPPIAVLEPQGFKRTITILPDQSKNVNLCRFHPLDKLVKADIMKMTQGSATSGLPLTKRKRHESKLRKPSLGRVAVSAFDADGDRESKDMECDRNRHLITSFTR